MKMKHAYITIAICISSLTLYFGICWLMGYPYLLHKNREMPHISPVNTGHEGEPIPNIELLLTDSTTYISVTDPPKGKPIVLFYFGPYCPYCKIEMDEITKNIYSLKDIQFYFLTPYSHAEMKRFYDENHLSRYSNIIVGYDHKFRFASYFNAQTVPFIAIYNSQKKLNAAFMGNIKYDVIASISEN